MYTNSKFLRHTALTCALLVCFLCGTGCRNESADLPEMIGSIAFDKERVVIKINEEATVRVTAKSDAAKKNEIITYTSVNDGIIEIREPTNDGFIVKGLKGGTTVVTAKSLLVTSYFEVVVTSEDISAQYITVAQPVIEMREGERRSTQVSLYGGSVLDNHDFVWRLENGKDNIGIDVTANIAVISGLQRGHQKIIVSHPKANYESEILVFVKGSDEMVKYISGQSNVILAANDGQYHDFTVVLVNGNPEDIINFEYEVTEGANNIEIIANGNVCNVKGVKSGMSVIRITHPLAVVEFDIRIIVYDVDIPFIVLEQTFLLMNIGDSVNIGATVEYARNGVLHQNEFSYEIVENDSGVVEVMQNNHYFYIRARRGGSARIVVSNAQAEMSREILVVVREEAVYRDDYYITTSQNVIMTQIGANAVQLNMQLVNGNPADANSFEWVVDDGTIITVESAHGIVRSNRAAVTSVFNAIAIITPKKTGTAKITVSHPKSEVTATIMVKVYPKGTFAESPIAVAYEGLIKVIQGTPKTIQLNMASGDILDVGVLNWSMADTNIATVNTSAHGMVNVLNAVSNGLTRMIVEGEKLEYPHESLVLAGTPEFVDTASVIYVDSVYQKMVTEQTIRIEVKDSQGIYRDSHDYEAIVEGSDILYAVMIKNQLVLQGKAAGETKVRVRHKHAINDISLNVRVDPAHISIDKPYYISGPDIKGVVRGISYDGIISNYSPIKVTLVGAGESEAGGLKWSIDDSSVAAILANGNSCMVTGKISNKQTKIRVSHNKVENEKVILLYVVENESDLNNRVALGLHSENYLLTRGQEQLITLITNASETQKLGLQWNVKYGEHDVITLDPHFDSAMVRAIGAGNAEIEVTHEDNIIPLTIYVSVVDALSGEKLIKGPAVIELIRGESKIVSINHQNLSPLELSNIRWSVEDASLANLQENGDSAYMLGLKKGVSYVNIRQDEIGYKHRATLLCANTLEELASMYVMGVDSSYHTMLKGDEKRIKLSFGSAGFPEAAKSAINWTADASGAVRVVGQGDSATVVAVNEGIGKVTVESSVSFNSLELTFEVRGNRANVYEFRGHEKIKGIVVGDTAQIRMRMYDANAEITNGYSLLEFENENDDVIGINTVDNIINITAKSAGQSYITVRHKQVNEAARILVYTANTLEELDAYYPILVEKTNYLLQVGESAVVKIETIESKDAQNFRNVSWGIENANVIENTDFNGKKEVVVKGRAEGQCIINVSYQGSTVARIFITVVSNNAVDMTKYILTENIIGLVRGESYATKIFSNLGNDVSSVLWESIDTNIAKVNGSGENGTLLGVNNGETYVTVSYGSWLKRHILVYVCDTKAQVDAYKAMNMENQYYRAGVNETLILPLYFAPNKTNVPTLWVDKYDNKVVRFNALDSGAKLEITTLNEGVAVLEAINTGLSNPNGVLRIYIEVSKRYNNAPKIPDVKYLTITKTVYVMNPDEPDAPLDLSVSGIGMTVEELANVKWEIESGSQYLSIYPNGKDCRVQVNRLGLEGDAELKAYHIDNIVRIKVIVSRTGLVGFPHITGDDVIRVGLQNKALIEYNVAETAAYDKNLFAVTVVNGAYAAGAKMTGNMLEVEGKASGQALLRITCNTVCDFAKEVIVIVTTTPDGLIYLTTRDNFNVVKIGEYKTLAVEMVGFDNASDYGYVWTVDDAHESYIDLDFTGRQAQVRGLEAGAGRTAKIVVSNRLIDPQFNLVVYVRVSNADINTTYITTRRNIVSVVEGRSVYLEAELVNGRPEENTMFLWSSINPEIISVEGAGSQVVVLGKQVGIGRVRINHNSAVNTGMEILVIVEKDTTNSGIYITTDSTLIDIKPNDTRQISVRLVGGNPEDIYGFIWNVPDFDSIDKINGNSQSVINLVPNADRAYITGIREGEATVRVTHPKTNYVLDIKVYVRQYSTIRFVKRNITLEVGETETVLVEAPAGVAVYYTASQYRNPASGLSSDIVWVTGTNSVCVIEGRKEGISIVYASDARGTMIDELVVEVKPSTKRAIRYIQTPEIIYNMTDWQSALNRARISGSTVGEKDNGLAFENSDDMNIKWTVSSGKDYIGLGGGINQEIEYTGKMVDVYTKNKPGKGEITLTHPLMPEYSKKIYVYVSPHDVNFSINPVFLSMQIGQRLPISATIGNLVEKRYDLINWSVTHNERGEEGIRIVQIKDEGQTAEIEALTDGICQVKASLNNTSPLEATVYVEKKRSLEILDESFIKILPNETRFIGLYVEPAEADIASYTDFNEFLTVDFIGKAEDIPVSVDRPDRITGQSEKIYLKSKYDSAKMKPGINKVMAITGKEREGYTQIRLTSSNIERRMTVNTNFNYMFFMEGIVENGNLRETGIVRGTPTKTVKIKYNITPERDIIKSAWIDKDGNDLNGKDYLWRSVEGKDIVSNIKVDYVNQTIDMVLNKSGYTELEFMSDYSEEVGLRMIIPIYVYYDRINLAWEHSRINDKHGRGFKSRLDDAKNAIYIADNETLKISFAKYNYNYSYGNGAFARGYYGEDIVFSAINESNNENIIYALDKHDRSITITGEETNGGKGLIGISGSDSLIKVEWVGTLVLNYAYSIGGKTPSSFTKTFMVYKETWSRK